MLLIEKDLPSHFVLNCPVLFIFYSYIFVCLFSFDIVYKTLGAGWERRGLWG